MKKEQQIQELTKATKGQNSVKTKLEERIENKEKIIERNRTYYKQNKDKIQFIRNHA